MIGLAIAIIVLVFLVIALAVVYFMIKKKEKESEANQEGNEIIGSTVAYRIASITKIQNSNWK